jgi:hypothetical protein
MERVVALGELRAHDDGQPPALGVDRRGQEADGDHGGGRDPLDHDRGALGPGQVGAAEQRLTRGHRASRQGCDRAP